MEKTPLLNTPTTALATDISNSTNSSSFSSASSSSSSSYMTALTSFTYVTAQSPSSRNASHARQQRAKEEQQEPDQLEMENFQQTIDSLREEAFVPMDVDNPLYQSRDESAAVISLPNHETQSQTQSQQVQPLQAEPQPHASYAVAGLQTPPNNAFTPEPLPHSLSRGMQTHTPSSTHNALPPIHTHISSSTPNDNRNSVQRQQREQRELETPQQQGMQQVHAWAARGSARRHAWMGWRDRGPRHQWVQGFRGNGNRSAGGSGWAEMGGGSRVGGANSGGNGSFGAGVGSMYQHHDYQPSLGAAIDGILGDQERLPMAIDSGASTYGYRYLGYGHVMSSMERFRRGFERSRGFDDDDEWFPAGC
jgi:hypothetical protein